ncbi:YpoC family protein [Planococcus sp. YIM B11945]|uniref:YpoC family protein n=1 Tax=Planococcus sp. YIM B11945 TaxID=3435410 RepID=UPI003D7F07BD
MKLSQKLTKEHVDPFFLEWQMLSEEISDMHKRKDKRVTERMKDGILLYQKLLLQCTDVLQGKKLMPLNGEERFAFIVSRAGNFAAYRQLNELFSEMKKIIAAKRVQLKRLD